MDVLELLKYVGPGTTPFTIFGVIAVAVIINLLRPFVVGLVYNLRQQGEHKRDSDNEWMVAAKQLRAEISDLRDNQIKDLKARLANVETEADGWRLRYVELQQRYTLALSVSDQQKSIIAKLETTVEVLSKEVEELRQLIDK